MNNFKEIYKSVYLTDFEYIELIELKFVALLALIELKWNVIIVQLIHLGKTLQSVQFIQKLLKKVKR